MGISEIQLTIGRLALGLGGLILVFIFLYLASRIASDVRAIREHLTGAETLSGKGLAGRIDFRNEDAEEE